MHINLNFVESVESVKYVNHDLSWPQIFSMWKCLKLKIMSDEINPNETILPQLNCPWGPMGISDEKTLTCFDFDRKDGLLSGESLGNPLRSTAYSCQSHYISVLRWAISISAMHNMHIWASTEL